MIDAEKINWEKVDQLVPAIVQDWQTQAVLMLGYMNREALAISLDSQKVTFFSRTKKKLWTKGESSGNFLLIKSIKLDCDQDTLLIAAEALGPTCHLGTTSCFGEPEAQPFSILSQLSQLIAKRHQEMPAESYTTRLFTKGKQKIAQKVGEEGVEVALAAVAESDERLCEEAADLMFHLLVLLQSRNLSLQDVCQVLDKRHQK
ncbi:MAG: bifunctional phosphoribosyl-AMP cyclohydrolase/phosphoribosyl-ATP diphosphatase HisIE [Oligoflexus sp.]